MNRWGASEKEPISEHKVFTGLLYARPSCLVDARRGRWRAAPSGVRTLYPPTGRGGKLVGGIAGPPRGFGRSLSWLGYVSLLFAVSVRSNARQEFINYSGQYVRRTSSCSRRAVDAIIDSLGGLGLATVNPQKLKHGPRRHNAGIPFCNVGT